LSLCNECQEFDLAYAKFGVDLINTSKDTNHKKCFYFLA